jgi:hypothetical protein
MEIFAERLRDEATESVQIRGNDRHMDTHDRRDFITTLLLAPPLLEATHRKPGAAFPAEPPNTTYLYFQQKGEPYHPGQFYVAGALASDNLYRHHHEIEQIRIKRNFCIEMRYSGTNKYKLPIADDVFRHFLAAPGLHFTARVIKTFSKEDSFQVRQRLHVRQCRTVLEIALTMQRYPDGGPCRIQVENPAVVSEGLITEMMAANPNLRINTVTAFQRECKRPKQMLDNYNCNNLLHLCDFLSSAIYDDAMGSANGINQKVLDAFRRRLGVKRLADGSLSDHRKFRVERR